ncbi:hypothetical protein JYT74_02625 [Crocinitomix catalasitica]|nr:hypothetical protein [Crocinitomix catalasitica]
MKDAFIPSLGLPVIVACGSSKSTTKSSASTSTKKTVDYPPAEIKKDGSYVLTENTTDNINMYDYEPLKCPVGFEIR